MQRIARRPAPPGAVVNEQLQPVGPLDGFLADAQPDLVAALRAAVARARQLGTPVRTEGVDRGDGAPRDLVVIPFTTGAERLYLLLLEDGEVGLHEPATRLVDVLATVEIPIVVLDVERRIRLFTPSVRSLLHIVAADVGRPLRDLAGLLDAAKLDGEVAGVIDSETASEAEVQDRAGRWYRMRILPTWAGSGRSDGALLSFVDIDALKVDLSDALEAGAESERANRAKDQFLATLSHELRSPLASMLMHAQLLRGGHIDDAQVRRAGMAIERGTRLQVQLIEDLIDVSRIVAGKLKLDTRPVDFGAIVREAVEGARAAAERKSVAIHVALDRAPGPVVGDPTRLHQIVSNLVTNAIKFTPEGGQVQLTLEQVGGQARLTVRDTGIGIEASFLPHVFNRFTQEDSSSTRTFGGLGLGLAIVRHLVELHGGTVDAESPGKGLGATLSVKLPLIGSPAAPGEARAPAPRRPASGGKGLRDMRVLVVDDDAAIRDAVVEMLEQRGARVSVAASADEALAAVATLRPEALVCDIAMPDEDGYGLLRRLRLLDAAHGGDTPALALTALAGPEDRQRALAAGFQLHLTKPVDIDSLVDALGALRASAGARGAR